MIIKALILSLTLITFSQVGYAAALKSTETKTAPSLVKTTPIEKALQQQRNEGKFQPENSIKSLTTINLPPSQTFFASQNERFSRFIQSIFSQNNS